MEEEFQFNEDEDAIEWNHDPKRVQQELSKQAQNLHFIASRVKSIQEELLDQELYQSGKLIETLITTQIHEQKNKRAVYLIHFSEGQFNDLEKFCQSIIKTLQKGIKKELTLQYINEEDIMGMLLKMYTVIEEGDGTPIIFMVKKITAFDYADVPVLHKSLDRGSYYIIIPTFKELTEIDTLNYTEFNYMELYNQKQLFVQFMLHALMDSELKAYLPSDVLNLITDMDYYPISFRENIRRFCTCLKRLFFANGGKFVPVEFLSIYDIINSVLMSFSIHGNFRMEEKFIRAVLDQEYVFKVPKSLVERELLKQNQEEEVVDDSNLDKIARMISKKLQESTTLTKYASYIGDLKTDRVETYEGIRNHKKDRMKSLMIPKVGLSKHDMLNDQITRVIKEVTQKVRDQSKNIHWQHVKYDNYCRPEMIRHIREDVQKDPSLKSILAITSHHVQISHSNMNNHLNLRLNEYHYKTTELEYLGLIEQSKRQLGPSFFNQIFRKADFTM